MTDYYYYRRLHVTLLLSLIVAALAICFAWSWRTDLAKVEERANRLYVDRDQWIRNYQRLREEKP